MKKLLMMFAASLLVITINSQEFLTNTFNRNVTSLNGTWNYIVDPYEMGYYNYRYFPFDQMENVPKAAYFMDYKPVDKQELIEYDFDNSQTINVPGDWNSQVEKLFYYEGTVWYRHTFSFTPKSNDSHLFLYFGAVNYMAEVYLNGVKLGTHEGGFTPFQFEISGILKQGENSLVVKVNNTRFRDAIPTINTDWWNYGGITRDVMIIEEPAVYIKDYTIGLDKNAKNNINGTVVLRDAIRNEKVTIRIPELRIEKTIMTDDRGVAHFVIPSSEIKYWSPEEPKLYNVIIETEYQRLQDQIGFRTISVKGAQILLNEKLLFLRGISIHEENPLRGGRAFNDADALLLLSWAKELGCNFVRLAHYPHNEYMVRMAEKMGIMVWEEIPVYWTIDFESETVLSKAKQQLGDLIYRDKNRAATIIWSVANETPVSGARNNFLKSLIKHARTLDPTRLISAALETHNDPANPEVSVVNDTIGAILDIISINQYQGWYGGSLEKAPDKVWRIEFNKPFFVSEFGGGALQGHHGERNERWTEEYQAYLYEQNLKMIEKIPNFAGCSPWILTDFRSPRRNLALIQDGYNRKGLISSEGNRKKAFFVLQEFYLKKKSQGR